MVEEDPWQTGDMSKKNYSQHNEIVIQHKKKGSQFTPTRFNVENYGTG